MAPVHQCSLTIKASLVTRVNRCGIDYGSSLIKVACYRPSPDKTSDSILEFRIYNGDDVIEALDFIKSHKVGQTQSDHVMIAGTGAFKIYDQLIAAFGQKNIRAAVEFECNKWASNFLCSSLPLDVAFHSFADDSLKECRVLANDIESSMQKFNEKGQPEMSYGFVKRSWLDAFVDFNNKWEHVHSLDDEDKGDVTYSYDKQLPGNLPCLVTMIGSACHWTVVNSDGSYEPCDFSSRCGITFLGLGSLLTGVQSFEELIALAATGDHTKVDLLNRDVMTSHPEDPCSNFPRDILCFSFGQARERLVENFRREDLARSLLVMLINDAVMSTLFCAGLHQVKAILIGGNLTNHPVVRHEILKAVTARKGLNPKVNANIFFLRHGGYIGALGALFL